jgi:hypothetical protein
MIKQCLFCGRYFAPDYRVKEKQKACAHATCRRARKKAAQKRWCNQNPGYFRGRYPDVKAWREKKRVIQDEIPPGKSHVELVLRITDRKKRVIQDEISLTKPYVELMLRVPDKKKRAIQDEIRLQSVGKRTFAAYGYD